MKYLSLQAQSFGSLNDREMVFTPGLNIIYGPNEAGKSTWHAALYLSLCGVKRGRGTTKEQREFLDRYRPWGNDEYKLRLMIELEDGRQVEIDQDLKGKIDCKATELTLGKEVTGEIIHEGSPDGSLWLNLNRQTFLATACVKQGELLEVLLHADSLQEKLQKSAVGSGGDFTVKSALDLLDRFQKEQIGKSNFKGDRPLSIATRELKAAQKQKVKLEQAYSSHRELLDEIERLRVKEFDGQTQLRKLKGALNWKNAESNRDEFEQASRLQNELNTFELDSEKDEEKEKLIRSVSSCLEIWENCPSEPDLSGSSASEIRWEIENLAPSLLTEPHTESEILDTHRAFTQSCEALDSHSVGHPKQNKTQKVVRAIAFFSAILLAGSVSVPKSWEGVDLSLALIGGVGALIGLVMSIGETLRARVQLRLWQKTHAQLEAEVERFGFELFRRLKGKDIFPFDESDESYSKEELERAFQLYRAQLNQGPSRQSLKLIRKQLVEQLKIREELEKSQRQIREKRKKIRKRLQDCGEELGFETFDEDFLVQNLREWLLEQDHKDGTMEISSSLEKQLQQVLKGRSLSDLQEEVEDTLASVQVALEEFDVQEIREIAQRPDLEFDHLQELQNNVRETTQDLANKLGQLQEREFHLGSKVDIEEAIERAQRKIDRLLYVDETVELTRKFLTKARDGVHREVAPLLAESVESQISNVTSGAYEEVRVDPENLKVRVRSESGSWVEATQLSRGTTEQIYLLLRAALAQHLTREGEVTPLLLDEVTVHFDEERKLKILETLQTISKNQQVILFTQEPAILRWAQAHLDEDRDQLTCLGRYKISETDAVSSLHTEFESQQS